MIYEIFIDGQPIYPSFMQAPEKALINPKLTQQFNREDQLSFTSVSEIPISRTSIVTVEADGKEISRCRPVHTSLAFNGNFTVECEGDLAFFKDSVQSPRTYTNASCALIIQNLLSVHNSQVDSAKRFTFDSSDITVTKLIDLETGYETVYDILQSIVKEAGGWLSTRKIGNEYHLLYMPIGYGAVSGQRVEFGSNLLNLVRNRDMQDIFTVAIPLGKKDGDKQLTVSSVNNGSIFVQDVALVREYGRIVKKLVYDNIESASALKNLAGQALAGQIDPESIEASVLDLHLLDTEIPMLTLGKNVYVYSAQHMIDKVFVVSKISIPFNDPKSIKITLGINSRRSLTSTLRKNSAQLAKIAGGNSENALDLESQENYVQNNIDSEVKI